MERKGEMRRKNWKDGDREVMVEGAYRRQMGLHCLDFFIVVS